MISFSLSQTVLIGCHFSFPVPPIMKPYQVICRAYWRCVSVCELSYIIYSVFVRCWIALLLCGISYFCDWFTINSPDTSGIAMIFTFQSYIYSSSTWSVYTSFILSQRCDHSFLRPSLTQDYCFFYCQSISTRSSFSSGNVHTIFLIHFCYG